MNRAARRANLEAEIDQWRHLVWYVVNRIRPRLPVSVSEEELFSAGLFGLMKACRSYDPDRGAEFKTYAYHRIRGAIGDELRRLDYLPRSLRDRARAEGRDAPSILAIPTDEDGNECLAAPTAASMLPAAQTWLIARMWEPCPATVVAPRSVMPRVVP